MKTTATDFRTNLYSYLDKVLETGEPLEIERKGRRIVIISENEPSKLSRLKIRPTINGNPEDIVHMDWSGEWIPDDGDGDAS